MLYTVLGLYDPAELAIDAQLIPSPHGFARPRELFGAQPDAGRRVTDSEPARHGIPLLTLVCAEDYRLRVRGTPLRRSGDSEERR